MCFDSSTTISRSWLWTNQWTLISKCTRYVYPRADLCTRDKPPRSSAGVAWKRVSFEGDERISIFGIENQPDVFSVFRWSTTGHFAEGQRTCVDKSGMQVQVRSRGPGRNCWPLFVRWQSSKRLLQCKYKILISWLVGCLSMRIYIFNYRFLFFIY